MVLRLSLLHLSHMAVLGAVFPYLAVELQGRGVQGWTFTALMVATPVIRLLLGPGWGLAADRSGSSPKVLLLAALICALGMLGLAGLPPELVLGGMLVFAVGRVGIGPLVDARTMVALGGDRDRYGRIRMWGSAGFLVGAFSGGWMRELGASPLWLGLGLTLLVAGLVFTLPKGDAPSSGPLLPGMARLLGDPALRWLLLASALHFAPHAIYDGYFAVHVEEGLSRGSSWAGTAIALGVTVETAVFAAAPWLLKRFSVPQLLLAGMLLALPRWAATALLHDPVVAVGLQSLHGITFGLFWMAAVRIISDRSPASLVNSGQGLLAAAVGGVGSGLANLIASRWVEVRDTHSLFWVCLALGIGGALSAGMCVRALRSHQGLAERV